MGFGKKCINWIGAHLHRDIYPKRAYLCDFDRAIHEVRPADVILVEAKSRISRLIKSITHSPWTHAALYVGRLHDIDDARMREKIQHHFQGSPKEPLIIESIVGHGTIVSPLRKYQSDHIRICRPSGLTHEDAQHIINFAAEHIGRDYDLRHFFDLGRFYLRNVFIPRRWNSRLFRYKRGRHNQSAKDVCSVVIADAFASVKFPILPAIIKEGDNAVTMIQRNPWLCTPSDFDYSPYFDIIKYPIMAHRPTTAYRNLPWDDERISHDEEGIETLDQQTEDN